MTVRFELEDYMLWFLFVVLVGVLAIVPHSYRDFSILTNYMEVFLVVAFFALVILAKKEET